MGTLALAAAFLVGMSLPAYSESITTIAEVNLVDGPNQNTSSTPNSSISSSASGAGGTAFAQASTSLNFQVLASSSDSFLINDASATASYLATFNLNSDPLNVTYPLDFNYTLNGTLAASSPPLPTGGASSAVLQYDIQTASDNFAGGAVLTSQNGVNMGSASGDLVGDSSLEGFTGSTYTFAEAFSLPVDLNDSINALSISLSASSSASPSSDGSASFNAGPTGGLELTSITVPAGYDLSPGLEVVFASGLVVPVTTAAATPEPGSFCLLATALASFAVSRRRALFRMLPRQK